MRVAALYDVHGNLHALEAVLADPRLAAADLVVCGGDVLWGPSQAECVERLVKIEAHFVAGNCERDVLTPTSEIQRWCNAQLDDALRLRVASWPATVQLDVDALGPVVFCHGSPRRDAEILTKLTPDDVVQEACAGLPLVVGGHTHVQFDRRVGGTRFVNAGSVGMPYEGRAAAFWALLGPDVELVSTEYDVEAAVAAIRATGYPGADDLVEKLLTPHFAEEATEFFENQRRAARDGA